ncbi:MAG TPA: dTDP-4-dehydrorhamnose 3,5-epimerase [Rhizobiaceae bacterium]|nr:dTDP-4-dehydrorhamnose 3,5-epimerase [Rhizobiaceae bacterium]
MSRANYANFEYDMQFQRLALPDVFLVTPRRIGDARGFFAETFSQRRLAEAAGVDESAFNFVQDNHSFSAAKGTLRGLHYQSPPHAQGKLVQVLAGRIFDVAVDFRSGSPTYGHWVGAELSAANGTQIWVPPGFLHGFLTLEPDVHVMYKVTAYYDGPSDGAVRWSDPEIAIEWPDATTEPIVSAKDAAAPLLRDVISPFRY